MKKYKFLRSRIATIDTAPFARKKNHVVALIQVDVTALRNATRERRRNGETLSLNSALLVIIARTIQSYPQAASFLKGKRTQIQFDHIHIATMVEKDINGEKVPIPFVLRNVDQKSPGEVTHEIETVRAQQLSEHEISFKKKQSLEEKLYVLLPGILRHLVWKVMLNQPKVVYEKMGNVIVTSVGMMGQINGWFVHKSMHPISFGIGSVIKKPWVVKDEIQIRQILNMTILMDHNVMDGAPMARFVSELAKNIEKVRWV